MKYLNLLSDKNQDKLCQQSRPAAQGAGLAQVGMYHVRLQGENQGKKSKKRLEIIEKADVGIE